MTSNPSSSLSDPTFRTYSASEANVYAQHRLSYAKALYEQILKYHIKTGGENGVLLDVGCGPGNATRDLAVYFVNAVGADPGEEMIAAARSIGGKCKNGEAVRYVISPAENISGVEGLEAGSVDLLTAAMAVSL